MAKGRGKYTRDPDARKYEKADISIRERKFIKAFTTVGEPTYGLRQESALKAGFGESGIQHTARRLMANPKVLVAIDEVYSERMKGTPTNIARIMSNLDNTEALALSLKSMPTLTKIAELRGKYLDIWASTNSDTLEDELEPMSDKDTAFYGKLAQQATAYHLESNRQEEQQKAMNPEPDEAGGSDYDLTYNQ